LVRVLMVEDDATISSFVAKGLTEAGFAVDQAANGAEGLERALATPYDAAIVDVMLPSIDGLTLVETLRKRGVRTPVLILSARHTVDDRVRGLQAGGDDYLVKPFAFPELLARVQALVRRASGTTEPTRLVAGDIEMDLLAREVRRAGKRIELRPKEFALLELLMRNAGHVVSKTTILAKVYDYNFEPGTNVVDVLAHRLRDRIDRDFEKKVFVTVRGMGYVLKLE
jgi:two-component system OmpR family response regulator